MRRLGSLAAVAVLTLGLSWAGGHRGRVAQAAGPPPMPDFAFLEVNAGVPPEWDISRFVKLMWTMPPDTAGTVTYFILESAFDPEFKVFPSSYILRVDELLGWHVLVGIPEQDGVAYYYRVWACNAAGCSMPRWAGVVARRVWPDSSSWNFYVACSWKPVGQVTWPPQPFRPVFGCGVMNLSPISRCDFAFYDGVAGYGGILRSVSKSGEGCMFPGAPGGASWEDVPWPPPYVSVGQRFGPWEVAVAVRLPGL